MGSQYESPSEGSEHWVDNYIRPGDAGDDALAIQRCIRSFGSDTIGGIVRFMAREYTLNTIIYVDRKVILQGSGGQERISGTTLTVSGGHDGFVVLPNGIAAPDATSPGTQNGGGQDSVFLDLRMRSATSRDTSSVTGSYDGLGTVTAGSAGNFVDYSGIVLYGCGRSETMKGITAAVDGTTTVIITAASYTGITWGMLPGMTLRISGVTFGGVNKVRVVSVGTPTGADLPIVVATAADSSASGLGVQMVFDLHASILSGGGTTSWEIDIDDGEAGSNLTIEHADCAIRTWTRIFVDRCGFGDPDNRYFQGMNIVITAGNSFAMPSNANLARISCGMYNGRIGGIIVQGGDANDCILDINLAANGSTDSFGGIDASGLGCKWLGRSHFLGGYGLITTGNGGTASAVQTATVLASYIEGGTYCSFGPRTQVIGVTASDGLYHGGIMIGATGSPYFPMRLSDSAQQQLIWDFETGQTWRSSSGIGGSFGMRRRASNAAELDGGASKGILNEYTGTGGRVLDVDLFGTSTYGGFITGTDEGGQKHLPAGFWLGGGITGSTVSAVKRYVGSASASPSAGVRNWVAGDLLFNNRVTAANDWIDHWVCITGGNPGTWEEQWASPRTVALATTSLTINFTERIIVLDGDPGGDVTLTLPAITGIVRVPPIHIFDDTGVATRTINIAAGALNFNEVSGTSAFFTTSVAHKEYVIRLKDSTNWVGG